MAKATVAISQDFFNAFASLPKGKQNKVMEFLSKFRSNPEANGFNYEKIQNASDPNMRSVRIDDTYRAILIREEDTNVYLLLWVDHHDEAYQWAVKKRCIGIYIRYFNQTKYENYLDYHKQQFIDTIALCPNWELIDFYVDEGLSAPNMESAKEWCRLLNDCFSGKIDLIITQKVSNVSRKPSELAFIARILAAQKHPVGMYFISEDLFTLATYYQADLREKGFLPHGLEMPSEEGDDVFMLEEGVTDAKPPVK